MSEGETSGVWVKDKVLGSGGFGSVFLCRNTKTGSQIAVKQCCLPKDALVGSKHRERWELEVQIMNKLDHPNVVKAFLVPEELNLPQTDMLALAMEYCSGGDLRKVLNKPENCCGLPEREVRTVLQNVSSAIEYLHSLRIIHRDLKPENIVLNDVDGKVVYKLIDLGYAKELDQGSLCTSFVGTVQYLAPELFLSQEYSSTVDFWSLGLLTHECITGSRPFLPNMTPAQWMPVVCRKKSTDICVHYKCDGTYTYSDRITSENHLSRILLENLERWLQSLLEWDSVKRGTRLEDGSKKVVVFEMLREILQKPTVDVFDVNTGSLKTYNIVDDMSLTDLYSQISADVKIPETALEFLLPRGFPPKETVALENWDINQVDEGRMLFVYPKKLHANNPCSDCKMEIENTPNILEMMQNVNLKVTYEDQLKTWAHCVLFCKKETMRSKRFIQSQQVLMRYIMYYNSQLNKTLQTLLGDMRKLEAVFKFYKKSIENDKEEYEKQLSPSTPCLKSSKLCSFFKYESLSQGINNQTTKTCKLEQQSGEISTRIIELQRLHSTKMKMASAVEERTDSVTELYGDRKKCRENKNERRDNREMIAHIFYYFKEKQKFQIQCHSQIETMLAYKEQIQTLVSHLQDSKMEISDLNATIEVLNSDRQKLIWKSIDYLLKKCSTADGKTSLSVNNNNPASFYNSQISVSSNLPPSMAASPTTSSSYQSLTNLLSKTTSASEETIRENREVLSRFSETSHSITSMLPSATQCDWDSLLRNESK